jgi:flagellar hook-associated protein 3 FlgL
MNISRVPTSMATSMVLSNINTAYGTLVNLGNEMSSGKRLQKASDGPAEVTIALSQRQDLQRAQQYDSNLQDAKATMSVSDAALQQSQDYLTQIRSLTIQAAGGSLPQTAINSIADQIDSLRDSLISEANTTDGTHSVFAGISDQIPPVQANGTYSDASTSAAYGGVAKHDVPIMRSVADGQQIQSNVPLTQAFGPPATGPAAPYNGNVFQILTQLTTDLRSGVPAQFAQATSAGMDAIDAARAQMGIAQGDLGGRAARVDDLISSNATNEISIQGRIADVEDIDLAQVTISLQTQNLAYQAALSSTSKLIGTSLVDFLR